MEGQPQHTIPTYLWERIERDSFRHFPPAWFQDNKQTFAVEVYLYLVGGILIFTRYGWRAPLWLLGLTLLLYLTGWLYDIYTTQRVMGLRAAYVARKLPFKIYESNPFHPDFVTLRQLIVSLPALFALLGMLGAVFMPSLGLARGAGHFLAGLNNRHNGRRARWCLAEADRLLASAGDKEKEISRIGYLCGVSAEDYL